MAGLVSRLTLRGRLAGSVAVSGGGPLVPDGSVTTDKLADGSVTTSKITDGAVTGQKLADGSVTADKLSATVTYTVADENLTIGLT